MGNGRLEDKVIIVTGGARGIGAAFSERLCAEGAKVVIADVLDGEATAHRISNSGKASFRKTDVTDAASVKALVDDTLQRHGRIDGLVNNAALFANLTNKPFWEIDEDEWDKVMAVNVRGPFLMSKAVAPHMMAQKAGKIVNIASGTVFKGTPLITHYVSSKGAIVAFTRCLARELGAHGINVNSIAPGATMSEAVVENNFFDPKAAAATVNSRAFKREQEPADLVGTLVFLCSSDSDFMTGQTLVCDGGSVMN